jgi:adenylyl-sulfate kinase
MLILQFTGLPGAGKSTLANALRQRLQAINIACEIIDGDAYRKTICKDLGHSAPDRRENIRRLAMEAVRLRSEGKLAIIADINPFEDVRWELKHLYDAKIIWLNCSLDLLVKRDQKDLYRKALLPAGHPHKIYNLTGINDPYEIPLAPDLILETGMNDIETCCGQLLAFVQAELHALTTITFVKHSV